MPAYNEENTIRSAAELILEQKRVDELIIVDDASTDATWAITAQLAEKHSRIIPLQHKTNQGKGAALRTGFKAATSNIVGVHDADLEYDPADYKQMLEPFDKGVADVVYGSRFLGSGPHRVVYFWHYVGNRFLTTLSNMLTNINLTDMETCFKFFKREIIQSITICENRFGFEPEITAKVSRKKVRIYEVPIAYYGRTYEEGKKIGWKDGLSALKCILKYNLTKRV
jgi:glycosyltransferase involved in cell wall biosynthesis